MESKVSYEDTFGSFRLDVKHRPVIHIDWDKLSSHATKLLTALIGRDIQAEADREEFYYWRLLVGKNPLTRTELNALFEAVGASIEDHEYYQSDEFPVDEVYQQLSLKLFSKILPNTANDSFADDKGVWFLGGELESTVGESPNTAKPYFFTMKVHYKDGREIGTRTGVVFASNDREAEEKAWRAYGSDYSCKLEVWEVTEESASFCTYYPKRGE